MVPEALAELERHTCLTFVEIVEGECGEENKDYVKIINSQGYEYLKYHSDRL